MHAIPSIHKTILYAGLALSFIPLRIAEGATDDLQVADMTAMDTTTKGRIEDFRLRVASCLASLSHVREDVFAVKSKAKEFVTIGPSTYDAFVELASYRSEDSIPMLLGMIGTKFCVVSGGDNPRIVTSGYFADVSLVKIGLPVVDLALRGVDNGTYKATDEALRGIVSAIVGKSGAIARLEFLKLAKSQAISEFVEGL